MPFRAGMVQLLSNDARHAGRRAGVYVLGAAHPAADGAVSELSGGIQRLGNTHCAFILSTCRLWAIRLPLIMLFRHATSIGAAGVWYAMNISNFLILIVGALLFRRVDFTPCRAAAEKEPDKT